MDFVPPPNVSGPAGPTPCRIAFVGEAPGEQEERSGVPFFGTAGQELNQLLLETGFHRAEVYLTNVLHKRPPDNKFERWCVSKAEAGPGYTLPPISSGKYLHPALVPELDRLRMELVACKPNLVVALGAKAAWALLRTPGITKVRGAIAESSLVPRLKVLPTFHPSYVLRSWDSRPVVLADLFKAKLECEFPDIRRPERSLYIEPTLSDLEEWRGILTAAPMLSCDIETFSGQITCIGFSPARDRAYVIPFVDTRKPDGSYWPSPEDERVAWGVVQDVLACPARKLFQNGLYDLQYLARMGLRVVNCAHDTMILHHALYPEMKKDLGFLGSIYTNEASWKLLRARGSEQTKRDE